MWQKLQHPRCHVIPNVVGIIFFEFLFLYFVFIGVFESLLAGKDANNMRIRSQAFVYTFFLTTGILLLYIYSYIVSMPFISVMICARASEVRKNDMVDRHVTENHVTTLTQFVSRSTIDSTTSTTHVSTTTKANERVDETASKPKSDIEKGIVNQEISDSKECTGFPLKNISDASIIQFYKTCTKKSWQNTKRFGPEMFKSIFTTENFKGAVCKEKSKQYIAGKPLIAMPSFPGSGNTWVRLLLEQMTGKIHRKEIRLFLLLPPLTSIPSL